MKHFLRSSATTSAPLRPSSPPVEQPPSKRARNGESPVSTEAETAARAKDFAREVTRAVGVSKQPENVVTFPHFNFECGAAGKKQLGGKKLVIPQVEWMDNTPRIGISNDDIPLVVHLPGIIKPRSTAHTFKELMDFVQNGLGGKLQKCGGADGQKEAASSYKDVVGQLAGIFKLVKIWHPVGHPHAKPIIARDVIKSGRTFAASLSLIEQMRFISARVNTMIQAVDPVNFDQLKSLRTEAERINYFLQILNKSDPLVMEGREIMWNRQTGLHKDGSDPARSWAVLVVFGPFTGGALSIPCLGLRMRYTNGTMIMDQNSVCHAHAMALNHKWERLERHGKNGIMLVLQCVAWWGQAIWNGGTGNGLEGGDAALAADSLWGCLVDDISWALVHMAADGAAERRAKDSQRVEAENEDGAAGEDGAAVDLKHRNKKGKKGAPKKAAGRKKATAGAKKTNDEEGRKQPKKRAAGGAPDDQPAAKRRGARGREVEPEVVVQPTITRPLPRPVIKSKKLYRQTGDASGTTKAMGEGAALEPQGQPSQAGQVAAEGREEPSIPVTTTATNASPVTTTATNASPQASQVNEAVERGTNEGDPTAVQDRERGEELCDPVGGVNAEPEGDDLFENLSPEELYEVALDRDANLNDDDMDDEDKQEDN
ncbi:hypothetical protein C8R47DRAFT_1084166 [Mycena vitilis]|nr:hypothetical protein C8R47DRAFT_1084166 [Mycena vitilis]